MVLDNFQCPRSPANLKKGRQWPSVSVVGVGGGCLDIFFSRLLSVFFLAVSRYRLNYCLKVPFNAKQPTVQIL